MFVYSFSSFSFFIHQIYDIEFAIILFGAYKS